LLAVPHFCYEAKDPQGNFVTGVAVGPGHLDVVKELTTVGYIVQRVWQKPPMVPGFRIWSLMNQVPLSELALLTRELGLFFNSGIGLLRGLEAIRDQGFSKQTCKAAEDVASSLASGMSLSQSMALRPDVFEAVYIRMIHAGEVSGALDQILERLSNYLESELMLRRRVQSALAYPALIFCVCVGLTAFMVFFLFPTFVGFFDGLDMRLPAVTQSLMTVTNLSREPIFLLALVLAPFIINQIFNMIRASESRLSWMSNLMMRLPVVGPLNRAVVLARFTSTLSILMKAGVLQFTALNITAGSVGNRAAQEAIERCAERIRDDGDSLSEAMSKEEIFPRMLVAFLLVGEEVGDLPRILDLASDGFELDVDTNISRFTVLLEPLMLSFMGLVVGYVLLAVFLPVYAMLEGL
jgi:type IV pilus assembly protein PilC